jgi:DNA helicase HerA-like ATPase
MPTYDLTPAPTKGRGPVIGGDPADKKRDLIYLGTLAETGPKREVWLDVSGEQVVGIVGKRGTGKSYTLGVLLEGLASGQGKSTIASCTTPRGGLVLDIMDIFWSSQIKLIEDPSASAEIKKQFAIMKRAGLQSRDLAVDVWVPAGFENPQIDPPLVNVLRINPSRLSIDDWGALFGINIYSEPRGMLIADLVQLVSLRGYDDQSGATVPPRSDYGLTDLLNCLENSALVATNYSDMTIRSVRQRIQSFAQLNLFQGIPTPLGDLIKPGRISVLMLARVPDEIKKVIVSVLISQIMSQRRDASFAQKRLDLQTNLASNDRQQLETIIHQRIPRTWLLMDEAHILAGSSESSVATEALVKFAKEGRNYGLSLAVATQQPSALDARLMSQVETLLVHQLTAVKDAETAAANIRSPDPEAIRIDGEVYDKGGLLRRLAQGVAVFSSANAPNLSRLCVCNVRPRITAHGGYEA